MEKTTAPAAMPQKGSGAARRPLQRQPGLRSAGSERLSALEVMANDSPLVQAQFDMVDAAEQSPVVTAQRALAAEINGGGPPVQRVIAQKGGTNYTKASDLPEAAQGDLTLQSYAASADKYLIRSEADLIKRAQGEKPPLLTPHRHLIGEAHNRSKFETALEIWGWGVDKMAEGFQTSATVVDKLSVENAALSGVGMVSNPMYQVKFLENFHAVMLGGLAMELSVLKEAKDMSEKMSRTAARIAANENVSDNKDTFSMGTGMLVDQRSSIVSVWDDHIAKLIPSYASACTERIKTARGDGNAGPALLHDMGAAMSAKWAKAEGNIEYFGKKPYGAFDSWKETAEALATYAKNAGNFINNFVEVFASHLLKLVRLESASLPGDAEANADAMTAGWDKATGSTDGRTVLLGGSEIREPFMANNINTNLTKPGLVLIGSEHVTSLDGKITDGKYHASYDAFVADTKK